VERADHHHGAEKQACAENDDEKHRDDRDVPELRARLARSGNRSLRLEGLQSGCRLLNWDRSPLEI